MSDKEQTITESRQETTEAASNMSTEAVVSGMEKSGKKPRTKIIPVVILAVLAVALGGTYGGIAIHYKSHFLPGTSIDGKDCSGLDANQTAAVLDDQLLTYSLEVTGRDYRTAQSGAVLGVVTASDINLSYAEDSVQFAEQLLEQQNIFSWPVRFVSKETEGISTVRGILYDEGQLKQTAAAWDACRKENMMAPENAYISEYSDSLKGYEIIPETPGTQFDIDQALEFMSEAIYGHETEVDIEALGCYQEASVKSDDAKLVQTVAEANQMLGTKVVYDWNGSKVVLDADLLKDWVSIEDDKAILDEAAVKTFVSEQASEYDTYGKSQKFMTSLGIELTLARKNYGWKTDRDTETDELLELIYAGSTVEREPVYSITAQQKGTDDIGSSYVEADLTNQHMYVYQDGKLAFETDFVSGTLSSTPDCVTPQGIFGLTYKTRDAVLRGANYASHVNYWMPFYGNYGMHDATWRSSFGGTIYFTSGSHGCINLPYSSAATIYEYVSTGFPVVCYYYTSDPKSVLKELQEATEPVAETTPEGETEAAQTPTEEETEAAQTSPAQEAEPAADTTPAEDTAATQASEETVTEG